MILYVCADTRGVQIFDVWHAKNVKRKEKRKEGIKIYIIFAQEGKGHFDIDFFSVVVCIFGQSYINHENFVTRKTWNKKI